MLKKYAFSVLLIVVLALASFSSVLAGTGVFPVEPLSPAPTVSAGEMAAENTGFWYVELAGGSSVDGVSLSKLNTQHASFRSAATKLGVKYTERNSFTTLWNGFSIAADSSQLSKIKSIPGVIGVYPVTIIPMPETTTADPNLFTALTMTGADIVQSELGYTGAGIKVGIIDTGIDVNHPAFGGDGVAELNSPFWYSSPRILFGRDFVGDAYDGYNTPEPDPNPDDCAGHGTHVAGIVGANDPTNGMKGVAPDVTFGAYRVFGCDGVTQDDVMLSAMEHAYMDGMQVINMSIGSAFEWAQAPTAVAASKLVTKGVVVVASIGNSGTSGLFAAGAPGLGKNVIGVASYDNTNVYLPYFEVNGTHVGYITMAYSAAPPTTGTEAIAYVGGNGLGCTTPFANSVSGKAALIKRGTCSFAVKAANAIASGATSVIIYNNVSGVVNGTLGASLGSNVPVVGISKAQGDWLVTQLPANLDWTDQLDSFANPTGGLISSFSSYGFSPELDIKPDLGAPGGSIYSSYPLELGGYATLSGTSMSSPHVAGAAALFLQARPTVKAIDVKTYLMNSALPKNWSLNPNLGLLDEVARQGAGMLQIDKAILSTSVVTPAKIPTGESQAGPFKQVLTIKNNSSHSIKYVFDYENTVTVAGTYSQSFYGSDAEVYFSSGGLYLRPGYTGTVTATIYPATGPDKGLYGGYIVISGNDGSVMRVPYGGFVGDYQSIQALSSAYGLPWLVDLNWNDPVAPFSLTGDDYPHLVIQFSHQVTKVLVEVRNANTHQYVNWNYKYGMVFNWVPRNSTTSNVYDFTWDGTLVKDVYPTSSIVDYKYVNDGTYYLVVKSLKALGNAANPADWETWTSPDFMIDRP